MTYGYLDTGTTHLYRHLNRDYYAVAVATSGGVLYSMSHMGKLGLEGGERGVPDPAVRQTKRTTAIRRSMLGPSILSSFRYHNKISDKIEVSRV